MLTKDDIRDAYVLMVSGAAEWKNEREMWWNDREFGGCVSVEFIDLRIDNAIERVYGFMSTMWLECYYIGGELVGREERCRDSLGVLWKAVNGLEWRVVEEGEV